MLVAKAKITFKRCELVQKILQVLLKMADFTIQEIKRLLVLCCVLDVVVFIFLVSLLCHQFRDEVGELALDGR